MQLRPPHFHFSNICLFFTTLSFSRERHWLCRPLGPQNSFLKRKKVKLLLPSPISILSGFPLPHPCIQRHWHVFGLGLWTFCVIFSKINLFRGAYQMGRGQTFSSSRQDHCWQNKDELVFESLSQETSRWLLMIFRRRGTRQGFLLETKWDQIIERFKTRFQYLKFQRARPKYKF